jgi:hypothetical protein
MQGQLLNTCFFSTASSDSFCSGPDIFSGQQACVCIVPTAGSSVTLTRSSIGDTAEIHGSAAMYEGSPPCTGPFVGLQPLGQLRDGSTFSYWANTKNIHHPSWAIWKGSAYFNIPPQPLPGTYFPNHQLYTPGSSIFDRGTSFAVTVDSSNTTSVMVFNGSVALEDFQSAQNVTLGADQQISVPINSAGYTSQQLSAMVSTFNPNNVDQWWLPSSNSSVLEGLIILALLAAVVVVAATYAVRRRRNRTGRVTDEMQVHQAPAGEPQPAASPAVFCPSCGASVNPALAFCESCGTKLWQSPN